jgi:hypothetical protein
MQSVIAALYAEVLVDIVHSNPLLASTLDIPVSCLGVIQSNPGKYGC